jgi:hypothetical protein
LSIWSISICGFDYRLKLARNKELSSETSQSVLVLRNEGFHARNCQENEDLVQRCVLHRIEQTRLFTVDVEAGVLRVLFNEAAS